MPGLILPEIVYKVKKKLGCIFVENHNSETIILKRGKSKGLVMSCVVTQEEQGQLPISVRRIRQASQNEVMTWILV